MKLITKNKFFLLLPVFAIIGIFLFNFFIRVVKNAQAAVLSTGTVAITDSRPSTAGVGYSASFGNVSLSTIKCIKMIFSTASTGATAPTGIGTTGVTLGAASNFVPNISAWTKTMTTNGTVTFTFAGGTQPVSATGRTVNLDSVYNGSTVDTGYYLQFSTYDSVDCATTPIDSGTAMFIWTTGQAVTLTVNPSLSFSLSAVAIGQSANGAACNVLSTTSTIPLGTVTASANAIACHQLSVSTNAAGGYTVYARYTGVPTSGSNTLAGTSGSNSTPASFSAPGTEAFGYTTDDASLAGTADRFTTGGGNKWAAFTTGNLEVAYSAAPVSAELTKLGYQVGISGTTKAGTYTTSVVLTATPTY